MTTLIAITYAIITAYFATTYLSSKLSVADDVARDLSGK